MRTLYIIVSATHSCILSVHAFSTDNQQIFNSSCDTACVKRILLCSITIGCYKSHPLFVRNNRTSIRW